jgi:KaiC/GvpD/RAD55 family RecA-like ATPase
MALKAVKPEIVKPAKPKFMISGRSGVGKTLFASQFEKPYLIDTEGGAVREQYMKKLIDSGGAYFGKEQGSQDFKLVIEEIKALATTKHDYKTLVIDSFSKLYNMAAAIAEAEVGNDFGRDKKEANKPTRQLVRWLEKIDMTVILICHQKDKYERKGKEVVYAGTTFDGWDKLEYDLDLWIEIQKLGKERTFIVKKSRVDSFQEGMEFPLDYHKFCELYGEDVIKSPVKPLVMATAAQVAELKHLLELVRLDPEIVEKWLKKAGAEDFEEMSTEQIGKCITFVKSKLKDAEEGAAA